MQMQCKIDAYYYCPSENCEKKFTYSKFSNLIKHYKDCSNLTDELVGVAQISKSEDEVQVRIVYDTRFEINKQNGEGSTQTLNMEILRMAYYSK
jgi:hypothetical protein